MSPLFLALALACSGSGSDSGTTDGDGGDGGVTGDWSDCDPIAPTLCGLPFPSTFHMREDSATPTGWRIALGQTTLPINSNDVQPAPTYWNERDGWSPMTPLYAHFPGLDVDPLPGQDDIQASLSADAQIYVVDADTGERHPYWAELDMSQDDDDRRLLIIHPAAPFAWGHRYVVGIRGLVDQSGAAIPATDAYADLRDGTADAAVDNAADIEGRRALYDDVIFPTLETAGMGRGDTVLAWDFVVSSVEGTTGKAVWMRDDALSRIGDGPAYTITEIEDKTAEGGDTAYRIYGEMTVPLYTDDDGPGSVLTRGSTELYGQQMPDMAGETTVPFTIVVPMTAIEDPRPLPLVQYGHGLLGDQGEVRGGYLAEMANDYGWILFAVDWTGMKDEDIGDISLMLVNQIDRFAMIPERSQQGFVEFLCAMRLMSGPMTSEAALTFAHPDSGEMINVIDPDHRYYYGNSQGAILGGGYIALSQDIERAALGVGGTPYALLLHRSADFESFFMIFQTMYPDPAEVTLWIGLMQSLWDSAETSGYATVTTANPLPDTPAKDVLLQVGLGDKQVTPLGAEMHARALGAHLISPATRSVWGLTEVETVQDGSALVEWDYGLDVPTENVPPTGDDPHEWPRREDAGQDQIDHFFRTGEIKNFCDGPCVDLEAAGG